MEKLPPVRGGPLTATTQINRWHNSLPSIRVDEIVSRKQGVLAVECVRAQKGRENSLHNGTMESSSQQTSSWVTGGNPLCEIGFVLPLTTASGAPYISPPYACHKYTNKQTHSLKWCLGNWSPQAWPRRNTQHFKQAGQIGIAQYLRCLHWPTLHIRLSTIRAP